ESPDDFAEALGAGPAGLFTAIGLSRRGHQVTVVARDLGPDRAGEWPRRGVMQFHHPHALGLPVLRALSAEMPDVQEDLLAAGAEYVIVPARKNHPELTAGLLCRRRCSRAC
ncbi:hypothetical protein ACGFIO_44220, partial [Actinoplanes sp. NPDC049265]